MKILPLIISVFFASLHTHTADMGIKVGSPEFFSFLKQQGISYNQGFSFVKILDQDGFPGGHLAVLKKDLESPQFTLLKNNEVRYVDQQDVPNPLCAYVKPIAEINGHGLFAAKDFKKGDVIGIYSGKVHYAPEYDAIKRNDSGTDLPINALFDKNAEEDFKKNKMIMTPEFQRRYFGDLGSMLSSRYAFVLVPHLPKEPATDIIVVDAGSEGNELRFINHASDANANCISSLAWMPYWQILTLSQVNKHIIAEVKNGPESYVPVMVIAATKDIKNGEQFLYNYGALCFKRLGITPLDLSKINTSVSSKNICAACGKEDVHNRCGVCKKSYYCGGECQKKDWPKHKVSCKKN